LRHPAATSAITLNADICDETGQFWTHALQQIRGER